MSAHLEGEIWCQALRPQAAARGRPALFLDRDGVVVEEVGYLHRPEDVRLLPGAAQAIAAANRQGLPCILVTNQSGIGRGYYGWAEFAATQERILGDLAARGAAPDMVVACPFHAAGVPPYRHPDHPCRKPRPGMLLLAAERLGLALAGSWIVGDRALDLEAGRAAGLAGGVHVLGALGPRERDLARRLADADFAVELADSMAAVPAMLPLFRATPAQRRSH